MFLIAIRLLFASIKITYLLLLTKDYVIKLKLRTLRSVIHAGFAQL